MLIREYGFSDENLEKFAELLFDFAAASPDRDATCLLYTSQARSMVACRVSISSS